MVRSKRDPEGRLPLENPHVGEMVNARVHDLEFGMDEREEQPSHWSDLGFTFNTRHRPRIRTGTGGNLRPTLPCRVNNSFWLV